MKKSDKEPLIPDDYTLSEIISRYTERSDNKHSTLASRIDYEWGIYIHENANFEQKRLALEFLVYAFDIRDEELPTINQKLFALMADRNLHKAANPDYIPGKKPRHLDLSPNELLIKKTPYAIKFPNDAKLQALHDSGELLDVNSTSRGQDYIYSTAFLSSKERNPYRVLISRGLFQKTQKNVNTSACISHKKIGFLAFVLTANGELFMFEHLGGAKNSNDQLLLHSSMNAGAPVIAAGEMQIIDGKLKAITTHSGHYRPTLLSIYRVLGYLSDNDVNLSDVKVLTIKNPSLHCPQIDYSQKRYTSYGAVFYATFAMELYQGIGTTLINAMENIHSDLKLYTEDSNLGFYFKDFLLNSTLTTERAKLAEELKACVITLKQEIPTLTTNFQLNLTIEILEKKLLSIEARNEALSQNEGKSTNSGRLATRINAYKKQLEDMKTDKEVEGVDILKKLS